MHIPTYFAVILLFISSAVTAQIEDDLIGLYDEDELVTIATGTAKEARFAPSVASVITAKDIKLSGAKTLDQALEMVPGLHVSASFNRQDAIYSIRGIHTGQNPQVLLLIDGVRVDQLFSGARPYNYSLPVANIERIEVIRGPGSAVYGADAFAGVISVTTKTAQHQSGDEVGVSSGSFGTREIWLNKDINIGSAQVSASVNHVKTDGDDDRYIKHKLLYEGALNTNREILNVKLNMTDNWGSLDIFSWHLANAGNGSGGLQIPDPIGGDKIDFSGFRFVSPKIQLENGWAINKYLSTSILDQDSKFYLLPPGHPAFPEGMQGNPGGLQKNYEGGVTFFYDKKLNHSLRYSIGFRNQKFTASESKNFDNLGNPTGILDDVTGDPSRIYILDKEREHYFISLQDEWRFANDWELTAGLRYDSFTQFGDSVNPRLALVWSTAYNLTTKFLYGRAFRAPSFGELYAQHNPALIGNPNLEPEVIDTFEVAFDYRPNYKMDLKLNIFYYEISDLIEVKNGQMAENALGQTGHGLELEALWRPAADLKLVGNYAWHDAEDDSTQEDIADAPQQQIYLRGEWKVNSKISTSAVVNWVADRKRSSLDSRFNQNEIDDYTTVDFIVSYESPFDGLEVSLFARNLFNANAREPSPNTTNFSNAVNPMFPVGPDLPNDYPLEGRSVSIEFTYQLDQ